MSLIVGIDGPAGSGKGTVTRKVAEKLNLVNIDSGATYRCVALAMIKNNIKVFEKNQKEFIVDEIDLHIKKRIIKITKKLKIEIKYDNKHNIIYLNDENITDRIREKDVTEIVSQVSSIKEIREIMVELQRKMAEGKNVIMEGRDICTVVFPNADIKIYLDASLEERAKRRSLENKEKGIQMDYEDVLENIRERDKRDKEKEVGALKIAPESIVVDTTNLDIEQVVEKICTIIKEKIK